MVNYLSVSRATVNMVSMKHILFNRDVRNFVNEVEWNNQWQFLTCTKWLDRQFVNMCNGHFLLFPDILLRVCCDAGKHRQCRSIGQSFATTTGWSILATWQQHRHYYNEHEHCSTHSDQCVTANLRKCAKKMPQWYGGWISKLPWWTISDSSKFDSLPCRPVRRSTVMPPIMWTKWNWYLSRLWTDSLSTGKQRHISTLFVPTVRTAIDWYLSKLPSRWAVYWMPCWSIGPSSELLLPVSCLPWVCTEKMKRKKSIKCLTELLDFGIPPNCDRVRCPAGWEGEFQPNCTYRPQCPPDRPGEWPYCVATYCPKGIVDDLEFILEL